MIRRALLAALLSVTAVAAADRHVFLDSDADGTHLNDCPNPAHNSKGTAGNTDDLVYCSGAALVNANNRIICNAASGCAAWTTTTGTCTSPANGGTATTPVTNGVTINFSTNPNTTDNSVIYGHPQACVYNMAQSDSCEIHAGTYTKPGAFASENALSGDGQTNGVCGRSNCWKATVVAFGMGPNLTGNAYGTSASPAYLRGAVLNSSTDTWDADQDKIPDCNNNTGTPSCLVAGEPNSYPPIFSGDVDADGVFDANTRFSATGTCSVGGASCTLSTTACGTGGTCLADDTSTNASWNATSGGTFRGDSHYAIIVGCGDPGYNRLCRTSMPQTNDWIKIDINADGVMDTNYGQVAVSSPYPATNYFYTKDIEFTRYNGGDGTPGSTAGLIGIRQMGGHITMHGNEMATGLDIDHIYVHDNDYSICAAGGTGCETMWSVFHDQENSGCLRPWLIKNSLLYQNNEKLFNDDCGSGSECGCGMHIHDNRIIVNITSSVRRGDHACMFYVKGIDTVGLQVLGSITGPKRFIFRNNEVDFLDVPTYKFHDLQSFGNMTGNGLGEFWVYGNLFRLDPNSNDSSGSQMRFQVSFSSGQAGTDGSWKYYLFNNTYDFAVGTGEQMDPLTANGTRLVERNNAYFGMRDVHATPSGNVTTLVRSSADEVCSEGTFSGTCTDTATTRTLWFTPGSYASGNPTLWNGIANYVPVNTGPLYETGSCDPDGNGSIGFDYDFDGDTDLSWPDIAGNIVTVESGCPDPPSIGAVQHENDSASTGPDCGNNDQEDPEVCDGTDLNSQTCESQGFTSGTLACDSSCLAFDTSGCILVSPQRHLKRGVIKRGGVIR